jgi:hypothetical protein
VADAQGNTYLFASNNTTFEGFVESFTPTGTLRWAVSTGTYSSPTAMAPVLGGNNSVYFGLFNGAENRVFGFNEATGSRTAESFPSGEIHGIYPYTGGLAVVGVADVDYVPFDGSTPKDYQVGAPLSSGQAYSSAGNTDGAVFLAGYNGVCGGKVSIAKVTPAGIAWVWTDTNDRYCSQTQLAATPDGGVILASDESLPTYASDFTSIDAAGHFRWTHHATDTGASDPFPGGYFTPLVDQNGIVVLPTEHRYSCGVIGTCIETRVEFVSQQQDSPALPTLDLTDSSNGLYEISGLAVDTGRIYVTRTPRNLPASVTPALSAFDRAGLGQDYRLAPTGGANSPPESGAPSNFAIDLSTTMCATTSCSVSFTATGNSGQEVGTDAYIVYQTAAGWAFGGAQVPVNGATPVGSTMHGVIIPQNPSGTAVPQTTTFCMALFAVVSPSLLGPSNTQCVTIQWPTSSTAATIQMAPTMTVGWDPIVSAHCDYRAVCTAPPPPAFSLTAMPTSQIAGQSVKLLANGPVLANMLVQFQVLSGPDTGFTSIVRADATGVSSASLRGSAGGIDEVTAWVDANHSGTVDTDEPQASTSVTWDAPWTSSASVTWSGYVTTAQATTGVTATWKVASIDCASEPTASVTSTWIGIDGTSPATNDLVQAGVEADCDRSSSKPTYDLFWQKVPAKSGHSISIGRVKVGDIVTADVSYALDDSYTIGFKVNGIAMKPITGTFAGGRHMTADCIVEAPLKIDNKGRVIGLLPLANFGSQTFSKCDVSFGGATYPIEDAPQNGGTLTRLNMTDDGTMSGQLRAFTGLPAGPDGPFTIYWKSA